MGFFKNREEEKIEEKDEELDIDEIYEYSYKCSNCNSEIDLTIPRGVTVRDFIKNNPQLKCEDCDIPLSYKLEGDVEP